MKIKERLIEKMAKELGLDKGQITDLLEIPPDEALGDYAMPCFPFAKEQKKAPPAIAAELAKKIKIDDLVAEAKATGPYLNLFLNKERFTEATITEILEKKETYGSQSGSAEKVMIEYSQPNTHKAFHVGHLRGTSMGEALARILKHAGREVIQANYSGDTGMHVAKWLWCYRNFHEEERPPEEEKGKWLASIYVDAIKRLEAEPELDAEVRAMNKALDEGTDKEIMTLWKKSRQWSIDEFNDIYKELQAHFDIWWFEREFDEQAKTISKDLLKKGIAKESDGATIIDLEERGQGVWVLLRDDGTPLYSAKDLALAEKKFTEYSITQSIYVIGKAQALHMQQLFSTLELMGFPNAKRCFHLNYEEVRLPEGKMSSRTGNNVLYNDLKEQVFAHTEREIRKRHEEWEDEKVRNVVKAVGICALKFEMIHRDHNKQITFDAERICDFEGDTGPYIQYTYARCNSILRKRGKESETERASFDRITGQEEYRLTKKLALFPAVIETVAATLYPEQLAKYTLELAKVFNKFYHGCQVIGSPEEEERALLVMATKNVLERGLTLLGIDAPQEM